MAEPTKAELNAYSQRDLRFYKILASGMSAGSSVENYASLRGARAGASVVVLGKIVDVAKTRTVGDTAVDSIDYAGVTVEPVRVLAGRLPGQYAHGVVVEFMGDVQSLQKQLPQGYAVWFLHRKGTPPGAGQLPLLRTTESQYYRLASEDGLFVQGDGQVINPLRERLEEEPPVGGDVPRPLSARDPMSAEGESYHFLSDLADAVSGMSD